MARKNVTKNRLDEFLSALNELGGRAGNGRLRQKLDWEEEYYWRVQGQLIEQGKIAPGRGQGGSVRITDEQQLLSSPAQFGDDQSGNSSTSNGDNVVRIKEKDLYTPIYESIKTKWINRFGFDDILVDETHSRGSKTTGGTYTRPDFTAICVRRYMYLPKRLEVITFEIKPPDAIGIIGVLEAIAHREAAHRAFTVFCCSRSEFDAAAEQERAIDLAQKYGIGLILVPKPDEVEGWEILIDAIRHEPDPGRLDRFLGDLKNEDTKKKLSKWKE